MGSAERNDWNRVNRCRKPHENVWARWCHARSVATKLKIRTRSTSNDFPSRVITVGYCNMADYHPWLTNSQATWFHRTWRVQHTLQVKNTLFSLSRRNFAKFCVAVSFTPVDPKFLVQQRFSLTLYPQRPAPVKVNETHEQYCQHNALVVVLRVRKIPKMKFILSCASSR